MARNLAILAAAPLALVAVFVATVFMTEGMVYVGAWILTRMLV